MRRSACAIRSSPTSPHFWLGIAKLNLGDPDGALREWKISEEQGAIQNTPYFAQLRDLIGRANSEKQRRAEGAATPSKQEANARDRPRACRRRWTR